MTDFAPLVTYLNGLLIQRGQGVAWHEHSKVSLVHHFQKRIDRLAVNVNVLENAIKADQIANPVFKDLADSLNRILEDAWQVFAGYPYATLHLIPSMLRKAKPGTDEHTFLLTVLPLSVAMKALKDQGKVIKRQPKPVEDVKSKYLAPRAGQDAAALVQQALVKVTTDHYAEMLAIITERYQAALASCLKAVGLRSNARLSNAQISSYVRSLKHVRMADQILWEMIDLSDAKRNEIIAARAKRDADEIRDAFIIKNLKKLDSIVERKGDFAKIEIIGHSVSMWTLQGSFRISFADGASFETRNSVVWGHSKYNRPFQRFPLTFHNARLANGTKVTPSEENINTIFCGKN